MWCPPVGEVEGGVDDPSPLGGAPEDPRSKAIEVGGYQVSLAVELKLVGEGEAVRGGAE